MLVVFSCVLCNMLFLKRLIVKNVLYIEKLKYIFKHDSTIEAPVTIGCMVFFLIQLMTIEIEI